MLKQTEEEKCPYDFKVFVYDLPSSLPSVKYAKEARLNHSYHICAGCIFEQFSLEFIVHDFFTQFCGRTHNPIEADYFYLPIIRDIEYRIDKDVHKTKNPSLTERALLEIMEKNSSRRWKDLFQITDEYWNRHHGADHIIVMPAPVTNLRHEGGRRGFFHYMSHLHRPIFLNIEYSLSFIKEYPICSTQKNIVMPYPSIDPLVYNHPPGPSKNLLLFYRGGNHGECMSIRRALANIMKDISLSHSSRYLSQILNLKHMIGYERAVFCPVPVGDSPSSKRMYDAMNWGCIPVVLSDDLVWAYSTLTGGRMKPKDFSIALPQKMVLCSISTLLSCLNITISSLLYEAPYTNPLPGTGTTVGEILLRILRLHTPTESVNPLVKFLTEIDPFDVSALQGGVKRYSSHYRYYRETYSMERIPTGDGLIPTGGAIEEMVWKLSEMKKEGIIEIGRRCREELGRYHRYVGNYPCDDKVDIKQKMRRL